jgi:hypothetical protein
MTGARYTGNTVAPPEWAADFVGGRETVAPFPAKLDAAQFNDVSGIKVVVGVAGAAANATSIPVAALTLPAIAEQALITYGNVAIKAGTVLTFGAVGSKKFAKLTADALLGATTLAVEALPTALVSGDTSYHNTAGMKVVLSGKLIGRTRTERDAGTGFGPWATGDHEVYLTLFDVDLNQNTDVELYRNGRMVKENYLPDFAVMTSDELAALRAAYQTITGKD